MDISRDLLIERPISAKAVKSIGVGVPRTANDKTGRMEYANNLPDCPVIAGEWVVWKPMPPVKLWRTQQGKRWEKAWQSDVGALWRRS